MAYLIGIDEAGYGPKLGPLVVAATVWQVPAGVGPDDLYRRLGPEITAEARRGDSPGPVRIADSKRLYRSGASLAELERGVLAALAVLGRRPGCWQALWDCLAPDSHAVRQAVPWYADYDAPLPVAMDRSQIDPLAQRLARACRAASVRLRDVRCRPVFPEEFNRVVARTRSKSALLSSVTLRLVAQLTDRFADGPVTVVCDKHSGRNRYGPLLAQHFPDWLIQIHGESAARSVYRFGPAGRRTELRFQAKAESCLAVALASMTAKYLRELAMAALNAYWQARVPGLRPTAGYPQDARRFRSDIRAAVRARKMDEGILWRTR